MPVFSDVGVNGRLYSGPDPAEKRRDVWPRLIRTVTRHLERQYPHLFVQGDAVMLVTAIQPSTGVTQYVQCKRPADAASNQFWIPVHQVGLTYVVAQRVHVTFTATGPICEAPLP